MVSSIKFGFFVKCFVNVLDICLVVDRWIKLFVILMGVFVL